MRKAYKIAGIVVLVPIVLIVVIVIWATLDIRLNGMPTDSPRVVETSDYRFDAPDGWITACADKTTGCLAVVPKDRKVPLWDMRRYWIEVHPVDSAGATTPQSFAQRALDAVRPISQAAGGDPAQLIQTNSEPGWFEGVQVFDIVDPSATAFSRSRVVQLPAGDILRFTCYAKDDADFKEHDDACFAALNQLHFPKAAALAAEQERARQQQEEQAARDEEQRMAAQAAAAQAQRKPAPASGGGEDVIAKLNAMIKDSEERHKRSEAADRERNRQRWTGPGWYGVYYASLSVATLAEGPYASQAECTAAIARNSTDDDDGVPLVGKHECKRLDSSPSW